ncbi:MAG: hypothetical protein EPO40_27180 [Myxococcaceae bacterium]|nr:MAG: hypothetical protein EPO40_27180 [Myxococcaceae bacterium]
MRNGTGLTPHQIRQLCVATALDDRPVVNVLLGRKVRPSTLLLVTRAARELGIALPTLETAAT